MDEIKEPVDTGPRPWNEPKIPMQQTKTGKEKIEEAIGTLKVSTTEFSYEYISKKSLFALKRKIFF